MIRVLVVDDHPAVALALKLSFRADGRFELAGSAATAGEGLQFTGTYDAVLLDLQLPDMTGRPLVAAFRAKAPETPLILHSAADDTPAVDAVRRTVEAVCLKGDIPALLSELARVTAS